MSKLEITQKMLEQLWLQMCQYKHYRVDCLVIIWHLYCSKMTMKITYF